MGRRLYLRTIEDYREPIAPLPSKERSAHKISSKASEDRSQRIPERAIAARKRNLKLRLLLECPIFDV